MDKCSLRLKTSLVPDELRARLREWEPWSVRIDFSNGVSTSEFQRRRPFSEYPLAKFAIVEGVIPFHNLIGGQLLDVGCNSGYNSLHVAARYGLRPLGIDVTPRHIEVSRFLARLGGFAAEFQLRDAEEFCSPGRFDVILHFGTLYHLPNPLRALKMSFTNLKSGGYLALETQLYDNPADPNMCYFMHMQNNDPSNFWALSTSVLQRYLQLAGFIDIRILKRVVPAIGLGAHMSRVMLSAQKPFGDAIKASSEDDQACDAT